MQIREISYDRWRPFFDDFTHLHHGQHVSVETLRNGGLGLMSHLRDLPLARIVEADPKVGAGEWIEIIAGESPGTEATCCIPKPSRVVLAEQESGEAVALQIESSQGEVTMVRFEPSRDGMPAGFRVN